MTKIARLSILSLLLIVGAVVLWLGGGHLVAASLEQSARTSWQSQESFQSLRRRYPPTTINASAQRLEQLASKLEIDLVPDNRTPRRFNAQARLRTAAFTTYLHAQLANATNAVSEPPAEVRSFLTTQADTIHAIEQQLITAPLPTWPFDFETRQLPSLRGYMALGKVMSVHALVAFRDGRSAEAWTAAQATSRLAESLDSNPLLITQLISIALAKYQTAVARKLPAPVPDWQFVFLRRDVPRQLTDGVIGDHYSSAAYGGPLDAADLSTPYVRMCAADSLRAYAAFVEVMSSPAACDVDEAHVSEEYLKRLAWWNRLGRISMPHLGGVFIRARNQALANELTANVLAAKRARASAGAWPPSLPESGKCRCRDRRWKYGVSADGTMTIALDPPLADRPTSALAVLPLYYSER